MQSVSTQIDTRATLRAMSIQPVKYLPIPNVMRRLVARGLGALIEHANHGREAWLSYHVAQFELLWAARYRPADHMLPRFDVRIGFPRGSEPSGSGGAPPPGERLPAWRKLYEGRSENAARRAAGVGLAWSGAPLRAGERSAVAACEVPLVAVAPALGMRAAVGLTALATAGARVAAYRTLDHRARGVLG